MLVGRSFSAVVAENRYLNSLLWQGVGLLFVALGAPIAAALVAVGGEAFARPGTWITAGACLLAASTALVVHRRMTLFPGTNAFGYILPAFCATFGVAAAMMLLLRLNYSGLMLFTGFVASTSYVFCLQYAGHLMAVRRFYVVPFGNMDVIRAAPEHQWILLEDAEVPHDPQAMLVADLRADHPPEWERMIAHAAISGVPVYHTKQLSESLTGKVEIEHMSENSFGSLMPNLAYRKIKRLVDLVGCLILLPVLILPCAVIAIMIKLDSSGAVLFRQQRVGYAGRPFNVLKFRTMREVLSADQADARRDAITQADDVRITRVGRWLRRSRLDELPQFLNVLRGEMSLVGPRPEAVPLSSWYTERLPFYVYRHIVRPGITGWAQVNQGHVADLGDVHIKLHYDFFYIKNFSAWLDLLIALRTTVIMLTGFGSK